MYSQQLIVVCPADAARSRQACAISIMQFDRYAPVPMPEGAPKPAARMRAAAPVVAALAEVEGGERLLRRITRT